MAAINSFHQACNAEKNVGTAFTVLGFFLLATAGTAFGWADGNPVLTGIKWTSLLLGALIAGAGIWYRQQVAALRAAPAPQEAALIRAETARARKLRTGYRQYRWLWGALLLLSAGLVGLFPHTRLAGGGYVLLVFTLTTVGIEAYSERQTGRYLAALQACDPAN